MNMIAVSLINWEGCAFRVDTLDSLTGETAVMHCGWGSKAVKMTHSVGG